MQNTMQMPLVHVMATQSSGVISKMMSNSKLPSNVESFLTQLQSLLNDEQSQGLSPLKSTQGLLSKLSELIQQTMPDEALLDESMDTEQMISIFMSVLFQSSESMKQEVLQNTELQKWLSDGAALLQSLQMADAESSQIKQTMGELVQLTNKSTAGFQIQFEQMQKGMLDFIKVLQQFPQNSQIQEQAADLRTILKSLISTLQQSAQTRISDMLVSSIQTQQSVHFGSQNDLLHFIQQMKSKLFVNADLISPSQSGSLGLATSAEVENTNIVFLNKMMAMQGMNGLANNASTESIPIAVENTMITPLTQDAARLITNEQIQSQAAKTVPSYISAQNFAAEVGPFLIKHMKIAQAGGISEAKISLVPEHLGQLNIRISMQNGHMVAQFMVDSMMGKEMLEGQLNQLRTLLQNQGIQVDKLEVSQSPNEHTSLFQNPHQHQQSNQQYEQNKAKKSEYLSFNDDFLLDFQDEQTYENRKYGGAFDALA